MPRALPLTDAERAEIYQGLARTLSAGLSAAQAMDALEGSVEGGLDLPLKRAGNAVRKGTALTQALFRQGLLSEPDRVLLTAAELNGALGRIFERLAARHARSAVRWRQMRGRLLLPAAVMVIFITVLPLPAVASGTLSVSGYLGQVAALLGLLGVLAFTIARAIREWRTTGTPGWLTRLARLLPGTGRMSRLHQRADACERLSLAFASGMPVVDALAAMHRTETNSVRREALAAARWSLGGGAGLAQALESADLLDRYGFAMVSTGESSGRLEDTLARVAAGCQDALDGAYALLAQWIPVVLYVMVAAVVAVGLLA